ncbi:MAG: aminotransferase class V-fold PLP-dependent enzyme [Brachybacterium sp.]|nr:aminotransferase class V-fold PLP-dependent enzyme [Brachybacterium sp.]
MNDDVPLRTSEPTLRTTSMPAPTDGRALPDPVPPEHARIGAHGREQRAFDRAAGDLQRHLPISPTWGDESAAVSGALQWAATHTAIGSDPNTAPRSAEELHREIGETITEGGIGHARALELFDAAMVPATAAMDHPMNLAYIPSAPTRSSVAFDAAVSAANVFGGIWGAGAGVIYAENQVLDWLRGMLGWPDSSAGVFVSGGTIGNLSALAAARDRAQRHRGERPATGWALACATTAHSSIASAAKLLDMQLIQVPVDERRHLTGENLAQVLAEHPEIVAVVCSGGTTNAGIVDDIGSVVEVAHPHNVWVHVDGAYGGAALAAPSTRDRFAGIERADSFIVDPHKWLFAPYDCCALLYREPEHAAAAHSQHAEYLESIDRGESNPSDLAAHLSRRVRGLPLWYSLASHGTEAYARAVERCLASARTVARAIEDADHLRLLLEPELSVVVFDRPGWDDAAYDRWSNRLARDGVVLCLPTRHDGEKALRMAFVNPDTDPTVVIDILTTTMLTSDGS